MTLMEVIKELPPSFLEHFAEFALDNILYLVSLKCYEVIDPEAYNGPIKKYFRRGVNFITKGVIK